MGKYASDSYAKAKSIELDYKGGNYSLVVILPNEQDGLAEMQRALVENPKSLQNLFYPQHPPSKVNVALPRFKIEESYELVKPLKKLGATDMFEEVSDFSGIDGTKKLYVSQVAHKTFIEVNEHGSEAAAVTGIMFAVRGGWSHDCPPKIFRADHPFLFAIKHR